MLGIVYEGLPDSDILALTLTLCYRVNPTESCKHPIRVDALVSGVSKKTHGDVHLTIVAFLLCIDEYSKKRAKGKDGKRMVVVRGGEGIKTRQPDSSEIHKEVPYRRSRSLPGDTWSGSTFCGKFPHVAQIKESSLENNTRCSRAYPRFMSKALGCMNTATISRSLRFS